VCAALAQPLSSTRLSVAQATAASGTIKGRISFTGKELAIASFAWAWIPCAQRRNRGKRPINEVYLVGDSNGLGNVFVKLDGAFPARRPSVAAGRNRSGGLLLQAAVLALAWVRRCA